MLNTNYSSRILFWSDIWYTVFHKNLLYAEIVPKFNNMLRLENFFHILYSVELMQLFAVLNCKTMPN